MLVKLSFFGPIRKPWPESTRQIEIDEDIQIGELLASLGYQANDLRRVAVVINGRRKKLSYALRPGDDVRLVLLAGGG